MVSVHLSRRRQQQQRGRRKLHTPYIVCFLFCVSCCGSISRQRQRSSLYDDKVYAFQLKTDFRMIQPNTNNRELSYNPYRYPIIFRLQAAKSSDDDEDEERQQQPGMADAFRQLESLRSLDDPEEYIPAPAKINVDIVALADTTTILSSSSSNDISPEQDFAVYKNMMEEMEEEEVAASYTEVLNELGGSTLQTDDTYSQIMTELGGTKVIQSTSSSSSWTNQKSTPKDDNVVVEMLQNSNMNNDVASPSSFISNEKILDDALKEALNEVQLNNPQLNERSILNDKEMMQEIESIFDRGNAQLIESIEEMRREQQSLAESKSTDAEKSSGLEAEESENLKRLQNAERSIQTILQRVDVETSNLEKAVEDLNMANLQIENDFIWKLKNGGLPKQIALVGLLLLSVRSILESITAVSSVTAVDSEAHLYAALIQGVLAMLCAIIFNLL